MPIIITTHLLLWGALFAFIALTLLYSATGYSKHAWRIRKARTVLKRIRSFEGPHREGAVLNYLRKIDPFVFEEVLLTALQQHGCTVIRNRRYTGDGGIDGQVIIADKLIPIQAKRYVAHIQQRHVEEFAVVLRQQQAPYGLFCHTGRTGKGAFSAGRGEVPIRFVSGSTLVSLFTDPEFPVGSLTL